MLNLSINATFLALCWWRGRLESSLKFCIWLKSLVICAFSGNTFRMLKVKNMPVECWGWGQWLLQTLTNVFLLLFAHREGCVQRRGVISRMFPATESAFIITAEKKFLGHHPSLFLVASIWSTVSWMQHWSDILRNVFSQFAHLQVVLYK